MLSGNGIRGDWETGPADRNKRWAGGKPTYSFRTTGASMVLCRPFSFLFFAPRVQRDRK
uniref:Uncharacterized protein n=1 Tax=Anguilla anguilla TaxID=7936 RepID=A0A0E9VCZ7_ANGAN